MTKLNTGTHTQQACNEICSCDLAALEKGQQATVKAIKVGGIMGQRLRDMGLYPGVNVTLTNRAPLGCPIVISLEGCEISLRCEEAKYVIIER